ncbi:MAG: C_GCAxxG_C_C family protein [Firmicutes bacterium]|nr:C_GCAxxG_C_C family protein [Bacillota bacterium]
MRSFEKEVQEAIRVFDAGFSCAEAVTLTGMKALGIESDLIPKIATGFGGGVSYTKSLCGAVAGGILILGARFGRQNISDDRSALLSSVQQLIKGFRETFGSENCYDLIGVDFTTPEGKAEYKNRLHKEKCCNYVEFVLRTALELARP